MEHLKVNDPNSNGFYSVMKVGDFEYANPIEKMSEVIIDVSIAMQKNHLSLVMRNNPLPPEGVKDPEAIIAKVLRKNAIKFWEEHYKSLMEKVVPENLFNILESSSKKEQIQLLKGVSLTGNELTSFIFKAWQKFGFTYSTYYSEHSHNGLDETKMPAFAYKEDNSNIVSIGSTSLTDGQIKQAIDTRKVIVSKFLDKGENWHCFFLSFRSLKGQENWNGGQPHLHYISHKWGLTRSYVLEQLRSKDYKLPSLPHIAFIRND